MSIFLRLLSLVLFGLFSLQSAASPTEPVEGVEYTRLQQIQPTDSAKKVEVLEFFWYNCPHCFAFEPQLAEWVKKRGDTISFKRVPVGFRESFIPQQKLYYTLETMGKLDTVHRAVFEAIHVQRIKLDKEEAIIDFVEKQGSCSAVSEHACERACVYASMRFRARMRACTRPPPAYARLLTRAY
jgi:thiol:disulfide interchange protein DsbA